MTVKGQLFVLSGPSGVGKDTIAAALVQEKSLRLIKLPTYTSRPPRPGEKEGQHYHFVSQKEFQRLLEQGQILEYNFYNGHYYGTGRKELEEALKKGKNVLLVIDVHGGLNIKKIYPEARLIFVTSSLSDIERRLAKRAQNTEAEIKERLAIAQKESSQFAPLYQFQVENPEGRPEEAVAKIKEIIRKQIQK